LQNGDKMVKIHDWKLVNAPGSYYTPPEHRRVSLFGLAYGHPEHEDGIPIRTSAIKDVKGRKVFTRSGSEYVLGRIEKGYRKWLLEERPNWDWRKPITVLDE
jgi:hypothetical protein